MFNLLFGATARFLLMTADLHRLNVPVPASVTKELSSGNNGSAVFS
jgi:hypothetical protein